MKWLGYLGLFGEIVRKGATTAKPGYAGLLGNLPHPCLTIAKPAPATRITDQHPPDA